MLPRTAAWARAARLRRIVAVYRVAPLVSAPVPWSQAQWVGRGPGDVAGRSTAAAGRLVTSGRGPQSWPGPAAARAMTAAHLMGRKAARGDVRPRVVHLCSMHFRQHAQRACWRRTSQGALFDGGR